MGFFSFVQEIAMDLGTANTIIISDDKIVVDEPSVVALDRRTDKMIAVGSKAKMMYEKTHDNIRTIRPRRRYSRLHRMRADDAWTHQDGSYWQPTLLAVTAHGYRCAFGFYRG